jgi:hypothetical protein
VGNHLMMLLMLFGYVAWQQWRYQGSLAVCEVGKRWRKPCWICGPQRRRRPRVPFPSASEERRGHRRSAWVRATGAMVAWPETAKRDVPMAPWWRGWGCQTASCAIGLVQVGIGAGHRSVAAVVAEANGAR